jgi:hypothetical protein
MAQTEPPSTGTAVAEAINTVKAAASTAIEVGDIILQRGRSAASSFFGKTDQKRPSSDTDYCPLIRGPSQHVRPWAFGYAFFPHSTSLPQTFPAASSLRLQSPPSPPPLTLLTESPRSTQRLLSTAAQLLKGHALQVCYRVTASKTKSRFMGTPYTPTLLPGLTSAEFQLESSDDWRSH